MISWNKDGDAFSVKNSNAFSDSVLPKFFKHSNYQSFVRQVYFFCLFLSKKQKKKSKIFKFFQLNMYDFHKYRKNDESFFKHPYFKREQKYLTIFSISNMFQGICSMKSNEKQISTLFPLKLCRNTSVRKLIPK